MKRLVKSLLTPKAKLPVVEMGSFKSIFWNYILVVLAFIAGTFAPFILLSIFLWTAMNFVPSLNNLVPESDATIMSLMVAASFFSGFGLASLCIWKMLKKNGSNLFEALAINLKSFKGKIAPVFIWAIAASLIGIGLESLVRNLLNFEVDDSAANFILSLTGDSFAMGCMIVVAVVGAGIFEELVFRGFVFNSLRRVFRDNKTIAVFLGNKHIADYAAVGLSSLIFALGHLTPTAIPSIFVMGCVLGELYRRTGSLLPSMLAHAINNLIAIILLIQSAS